MLIDKSIDSDEKCRCERLKREIHCTDCGSFQIIRRAKFVEVETDKGKFPVHQYFCRRCSFVFNDIDRHTNCNAPEQALSIRAQRAGDKVREAVANMSLEERHAQVREMFSKLKKEKT
jgi:hypothetical protein